MTDDMVHGGALAYMRTRFPRAAQPWIDLSTGINPWPYPLPEFTVQDAASLPDRSVYEKCRLAAAHYFGVDPEYVALVPGTELIIRLLPTLLAPHMVAILSPTYSDHPVSWQQSGITYTDVNDPLAPEIVARHDIVVLCNPNNPDGRRFSPDQLDVARQSLAHRSGWLIIDEAYADLLPEMSMASKGGQEGLIILRSFGKFFGLGGLRLGALIAPAHLIGCVTDRLGSWPISSLALKVGSRAYRDIQWQKSTRDRLQRECLQLDRLLDKANINVTGGTALFRYIRHQEAHRLWHHLGANGIYARRFSWSDTHLRLGLPLDDVARDRLSAALSSFQL